MNKLANIILADTAASNDTAYPLNISKYMIDNAPDMVATFGDPAKGDTNLDHFKTNSVTFDYGMFQPEQKDVTKVALNKFTTFNRFNNQLYPMPAYALASTGSIMDLGNADDYVTSLEVNGKLYITGTVNPTTNRFGYVTTAGAYTNIATMPAALNTLDASSTLIPIQDICAIPSPNGGSIKLLLVGGVKNSNGTLSQHVAQLYDPLTGTWVAVGGGLSRVWVLRGVVYGVNAHGDIYTVKDPTAASWAWTLLTNIGLTTPALQPTKVINFNGATYIQKARPKGNYTGNDFIGRVYRFDGITAQELFRSDGEITEFNGAIWYRKGNKIFSFNGATIRLEQDFGNAYTIWRLRSTSDGLYVISYNFITFAIKDGKVDPNYEGGYFALQIFKYDGYGWYYQNEMISGAAGWWSYSVHSFNNDMLLLRNAPPDYTMYFTFGNEKAYSDITTSKAVAYVTTSEFDAGYPVLTKNFAGHRVIYDAITAGDSIEVYARTFTNGVASTYVLVQTITSTDTGKAFYYHLNDLVYTGNKVQYYLKVTKVATSQLSIRGFSNYYVIMPRKRKAFTFVVSLQGVAQATNPLGDIQPDNAFPAVNSEVLEGVIDTCIASSYFVALGDIWGSPLKVNITNSGTTLSITSQGGLLLNNTARDDISGGYYLMLYDPTLHKFEIVKTANTFGAANVGTGNYDITLTARGAFNTAARAFATSNSCEVRAVKFVDVLQKSNHQYLIGNDGDNSDAEGMPHYNSMLNIQAVEV